MSTKRNTPIRASLAERLWRRYVVTDSGCWIFTGCRHKTRGYGSIGVGRRPEGTIETHRAAWLVTRGEIPSGMFVCHRCDNPPCINPDHLFLGTVEDNNRDMREKGRAVYPISPRKFSHEQVAEIVNLYLAGGSPTKIARQFGTSRQYVGQLVQKSRRPA